MRTCKLLLALLLAAALASAQARSTRSLAQKVTNACEEACPKKVEPVCVSHFDTGCKPSWWMNREGCMSIPADLPRTRRVMWNACKYRCIKEQFNWEKWRLERIDGKKVIKMSAWCKRQWRKYGFAADEKCQKC